MLKKSLLLSVLIFGLLFSNVSFAAIINYAKFTSIDNIDKILKSDTYKKDSEMYIGLSRQKEILTKDIIINDTKNTITEREDALEKKYEIQRDIDNTASSTAIKNAGEDTTKLDIANKYKIDTEQNTTTDKYDEQVKLDTIKRDIISKDNLKQDAIIEEQNKIITNTNNSIDKIEKAQKTKDIANEVKTKNINDSNSRDPKITKAKNVQNNIDAEKEKNNIDRDSKIKKINDDKGVTAAQKIIDDKLEKYPKADVTKEKEILKMKEAEARGDIADVNKKAVDDNYTSQVKADNAKIEANKKQNDNNDYEIKRQQAILDSKNPKPTNEEIGSALKKIENANKSKLENLNEIIARDPDVTKYNKLKGEADDMKFAAGEAKNAERVACKTSGPECEAAKKNTEKAVATATSASELAKDAKADSDSLKDFHKEEQEEIIKAIKESKDKYDDSKAAEGDIASRGFQISVNDISPGMNVNGGTTNQNINFVLGTIIQNLMIALGSFSLLIMTVGAGYIVLHNGQDELLNKGKSIFMSGVYALVVALGSYYLVSMIRFILYS